MHKFHLYRFLDIFFATLGIVLLSPVILVVIALCLYDTGSPFFIQERVGKNKRPFLLIKFRTMAVGTASVASHLASQSAITRLGRFLRRLKLDELPQLINVLKGEMSLVGPRPCLFNQQELIEKREQYCVFSVRPGITGLAQINGIDMSKPSLLAEVDAKMIKEISIANYFRYLIYTVLGKGSGDAINCIDDKSL